MTWTKEWWKIWRKTDSVTRILWTLIWALKSLNDFQFDCSLLCKGYVWPKKYKGVIFHDIEVSCNIWRKTDLWFGKWHEEFGKFPPEYLEVSKVGLHVILLSKIENAWLMTLKNDEKFEKELTCGFKIDIMNLKNFDSSTQKSQKFKL